MKALFVAYQDPSSRMWAPVGKLTRVENGYRFAYTEGVKKFHDFVPFGRMTNLYGHYFSEELFPLFANRVLPKTRPEYAQYMEWLGLRGQDDNDIEELSRTGGLRATDSLELIPCPEPSANSTYETFFFCRGLRHASVASRERADELKSGERLFIMNDIQNERDRAALMLRTDDPVSLIGYTPAYFTKDFSSLLAANPDNEVRVVVEKVNRDAPAQFRVLCRLTAPWPASFSPCEDRSFHEIAEA
jgi:hypothetical protein